jgi:hypothetical protein
VSSPGRDAAGQRPQDGFGGRVSTCLGEAVSTVRAVHSGFFSNFLDVARRFTFQACLIDRSSISPFRITIVTSPPMVRDHLPALPV